MDREEMERLRISATLEKSHLDVTLSDKESTEENYPVSERNQPSDIKQEILDNADIPLCTIKTRIRTDCFIKHRK